MARYATYRRTMSIYTCLDIEACLCTRLDEHYIELPGLCIAFLNGHLPAVQQPCIRKSRIGVHIIQLPFCLIILEEEDLRMSIIPLVHQVSLVPHKHDNDIAATLCPDLLNPPRCVQKRLTT